MDAKPSSVGVSLLVVYEGVCTTGNSASGSTKIGRASCKNPNGVSADRFDLPPGIAGANAAVRRSGAMLLSGTATKAPGCASARLANWPGNAGAVGLGGAAYGLPLTAELDGSTAAAAVAAGGCACSGSALKRWPCAPTPPETEGQEQALRPSATPPPNSPCPE
jgi:hypothetical protein